MKAAFHLLLIIIASIFVNNEVCALFGIGNKKKDEEKNRNGKNENDLTIKETIYAGLSSLKESSKDPNALQETLDMMNDPEAMREVQKLMQDPEFIKEMEALKKDPAFVSAVSAAKTLQEDPKKADALIQQVKEDAFAAGVPRSSLEPEKISDAQLGLQELAKAARNPKALVEAMEMLKDPEIAAEVQAMMKDPSFQAEMKKFSQSSQFQSALKQTAEEIENLKKDPELLSKLQRVGQEL